MQSKDIAGLIPCSACEYSGNPPENRFCGRCGAPLERALARGGDLAPRAESRVVRKRFLPYRLGPVGKTLAVSLAVLAADAGLAWLRHRIEKTGRSALSLDPADHAWREKSGNSLEYLHSYTLREAALLLRDEKGTRGWFSSELTVKVNNDSGERVAAFVDRE
jgi:hypothetical protein